MPAGFYNGEVMFADNVRFDGGTQPGQVTADGQLMIGSAVAPHIRVATLTSSDASVTITNGAGTIDLKATGGGGGGVSSVTTSNASVQFVNTAGVEDIDFHTANLVLGSNLAALTSGSENAGFGSFALNSLTSGVQNTATGQQALQNVTSGYGNDAHGYLALGSNVSGNENAAFGDQALNLNQGSNNCAFGSQSLSQANANNNTAMGYLSGRSISSGTGNVAIGFFAMVSGATASYSVGVGYQALQSCTGSANTCVGANSGVNYTGAETNNICLGQNVFGTLGQSNSTQIGDGTQTSCKIGGIAGVTVSNQLNVVIDSTTGQLGTTNTPVTHTAEVTLTSAQIKNLHATPIDIVPAQGVGKVIVPISIISKFIYGGSNVFVAGASQSIQLSYGTVTQILNIAQNAVIVANASSYSNGPSNLFTNIPSANVENMPLTAYNPIATEISGNAADDNTITIVVLYYVVDI